MTGNTKTIKGSLRRKVYAIVRESEYEYLQKEIPDMFNNPEVKVEILSDEIFDQMIKEKMDDDSYNHDYERPNT